MAAPVLPAPPGRSPASGRPPLALVVGLAAGVLGTAGLMLWRLSFLDHGDLDQRMGRWAAYRLLSFGLASAVLGFLLVGVLELRARATGWGRTGARVALIALLAQGGTLLLGRYIFDFHMSGFTVSSTHYLTIVTWVRWSDALAALGFVLGIGLTAWHLPRRRWLIAPLLLLQYISAPVFLDTPLAGTVDSAATGAAIHIGLELGVSGLLLVLAWAAAPLPLPPAWNRAADAFDRVDRALVLRLWIAGIAVGLVLLLWSTPASAAVSRLWFVGVPLGNAVTGVLLAAAVLSASLHVPGGRARLALLVAGAGLLMVVSAGALQAAHLVQLLLQSDQDRSGQVQAVSALPLALPVLAAAAHVALAAALVAVARALTGGASALTDAAVRGWVAVVCTQLLVLAAPYGLTRDEPPSTSTMLLLLLLAAVAGLVGVLVLVRVTRQVALAARGHGSLPTATLRGS
jgi:hypothetical protein